MIKSLNNLLRQSSYSPNVFSRMIPSYSSKGKAYASKWTLALVTSIALCPSIILAQENEQDPELKQRIEKTLLNERARLLYRKVRCTVCANQSIESSEADIAIQLRKLVYDMLKEDKQEKEIIKYLCDKFGTMVVYDAPGSTEQLWKWLVKIQWEKVGLYSSLPITVALFSILWMKRHGTSFQRIWTLVAIKSAIRDLLKEEGISHLTLKETKELGKLLELPREKKKSTS